ncbi:hypothetical protein Tco_0091199 [Tanacetum coccineum]
MKTRFRDTERRMMTALEMVNMRKDRAAVRPEIELLRRERLTYEQESIQTRQDLARFEAYCRALEARVTVLETEVLYFLVIEENGTKTSHKHVMQTGMAMTTTLREQVAEGLNALFENALTKSL